MAVCMKIYLNIHVIYLWLIRHAISIGNPQQFLSSRQNSSNPEVFCDILQRPRSYVATRGHDCYIVLKHFRDKQKLAISTASQKKFKSFKEVRSLARKEAKHLLKRHRTAHSALLQSYFRFTRADFAIVHFVDETKIKLQSPDAWKGCFNFKDIVRAPPPHCLHYK